jgi:hypothetical protein
MLGILAGCSGLPGSEQAGNTVSLMPDDPTVTEMDIPVWVMGPLEEYIVRITGDPLFDSGSQRQAAMERAHLEAEAAIVSCMHAQGFDYLIQPTSGRYVFDPREIEFSVPHGSRQWAEVYGFGHTHPDLQPPPGPPFTLDRVEGHHSRAILEDMTPAQVDAWFDALYGDESDEQFGGCFGQSRALLWWYQEIFETGFESFASEVWDLWHRMFAGDVPSIAALDAEWQQCMSDTGLNYFGARTPRRLSNYLSAELNNLNNQIRQGWVPPAGTESERMGRETALAVASWDCRYAITYDVRRREIELKLEQDFVDRHKNELELWALLNEEARSQ